MTQKSLSKQVISAILALIIFAVSVPIAFAAEPIALTTSNVTEWPTATYKNGEAMYFGQSISEAISLIGGKVEYNGVTVPGHFEFIDSTLIPEMSGTQRSNLKFIPDDESTYSGFEKNRSRDVTFVVSVTTPVFKDEVNNPIVATDIEAGAALSTSSLSGGSMYNPYKPDEPNILAASWQWRDPSTIVNQSGYYEARIVAGGYEQVNAQVYVRIAGEIPETTITEAPTVPTLTYDGVTTWGDIPLEGGKAELKVEGTAVEGTFAVTDFWKTRTVNIGSYEIDVVFTPADPEAALPYSLKIPVTVNKAPIRFVDENGNDIVPEITVPYGTKFNDISRLLRPYVKGADYTYFVMGDLSSKVCEDGTYTVKATAPDDGEHYEDTDLTFKIVVEKKKLNPKLYSASGKLYINDNSAVYHPTGTFTLEYTIDGVEQTPITGIKYNTHFDWNPTKSGDYEYTIIYNEAAEKEYFIIDDFTTNSTIALTWGFKATGSVEGTTYKYGSEVALEAPATDPAKEDKPFYGFVKWEDANGNTGLTEEELSNKEISFTMPDGDVELNATYKFDFCLCIRYYIQIVVDWFNSFFQSIGTLF